MIKIDMLKQDSVSIKDNLTEGKTHRKAYINTEKGRQEVIAELPEDIQNEIFAVWGDTPTVVEPEPEPVVILPDPDEELVLAIEASTNFAELKAALLGNGNLARVKGRATS